MSQFAILGIGNFGFYLGTALFQKGHEVLMVDISPAAVQKIKDLVSEAVVADVTDRETLEAMGVADADAVAVCIGANMQSSILATLHLKEMGVKRILAKAASEEHGRILATIGADQIIFPDRDQAFGLAAKLDNPNMIDYLPFIEGHSIVEITPPANFISHSLKELDLINRFGVQVLAVRIAEGEKLTWIPTAKYQIKDGDVLIVIGPDRALKKIEKL